MGFAPSLVPPGGFARASLAAGLELFNAEPAVFPVEPAVFEAGLDAFEALSFAHVSKQKHSEQTNVNSANKNPKNRVCTKPPLELMATNNCFLSKQTVVGHDITLNIEPLVP